MDPEDQHSGDDGKRAAAFIKLYSENSRRLYSYILTVVPNRTDADEVFSDLSLVLWEKFGEFKLGTNFGAWASRVAYFSVLRFRKSRARVPVAFSQLAIDAIDADMATMDDTLDEEYKALAGCFAELSGDEQSLLERRYAADGSPRRIAAEDKLPVAAVYKSLERLRNVLFECVRRKLSEGGLL